MRFHANHRDVNATEIYSNLGREGWVVREIVAPVAGRNSSKGLPDAIVSRVRGKRCPRNHLLEIKAPGGVLNENQIEFMRVWPGCIHIATSSLEAIGYLEECEGRP